MGATRIMATLSCLLLGICLAACNQTSTFGEPGLLIQIPPVTQVTTQDQDDEIVGRLWVLTNPIRIRPGWGASGGGDGQPVGVDVVNIGSEDLYVDNIYITGSTDFVMPDPSAGYGLPIPLAPGDCCSSTNGVFFPLEYQPGSGSFEVGRLVLETSDPTSPGYEVPIIFDHTGELTPDDPMLLPPHSFESHLLVKPNPIRFTDVAVGVSQDVEVCLHHAGDVPPVVTSPRVSGEGLSLLPGTDELEFTVRLLPEHEGPVDGSLSFDFTDSWGDVFTLTVPVIVL